MKSLTLIGQEPVHEERPPPRQYTPPRAEEIVDVSPPPSMPFIEEAFRHNLQREWAKAKAKDSLQKPAISENLLMKIG